MPSIVGITSSSPAGLYPPSYVQMGDKCFCVRGDQRPKYWLASQVDSTIKPYQCGIKPPTNYLFPAFNAVNAKNIEFDTEFPENNTLYFVYAYYSSVRNVYSQVSPAIAIEITNPPKQIVISGFYFPRDDAFSQDIDTIVIGCQFGLIMGYMSLLPDMSIPIPNGDVSGLEIIFDLSSFQLLNGGFNLGNVSLFSAVPPASRFITRFGERLWYAGQRQKVVLDHAGLSVTKALLTGTISIAGASTSADVIGTDTLFETELMQYDYILLGGAAYFIGTVIDDEHAILTGAYPGATQTDVVTSRLFRDEPLARLILTPDPAGGFQGFDDSMLYMNVFANGQFLGAIFDIISPTIAYLDRDIPANVSQTADWYLTGNNNAIYPSGWTNSTSGNFPTAYPECWQLPDVRTLTQSVDEGQKMMGLQTDGEYLYVIFNETVVQMLGGNEINSPIDPSFRAMQGRVGAIAPRSICKDNVSRMAWIGEEGIALGDSAGIDSVAHQLGCNLFFGKSPRWIDKTTLSDIVQTYSRYYDGFVFAGFKVNSTTLDGTLYCATDNNNVFGVGTDFTTLRVGDILTIGGLPYCVLSVVSSWYITIETFIGATGAYTGTLGTGYFSLLSVQPQYGLWLMNGQEITSNLIEYQDTYGQGVILGGTKPYGSVRRIMRPQLLKDQPPGDGEPVSYKFSRRSGWATGSTGDPSTLDKVNLPGLILPGDSISFQINHWHHNFPVRDENLIPADQKIEQEFDFTDGKIDGLLQPMSLETRGHTRYHSVELEFDSYNLNQDETAQTEPIELVRWQEFVGG